jgi:hypothetical protein
MYKVSDLIPVCVLPTYDHDVLYIHKDDIDKEMSVCLFMDYNSKEKEPILLMHQTQMYLTRSLIDYEIEQTPENIKFYLDRLVRKYPDKYIEITLDAFEKFRDFYNASWKNLSTDELFQTLISILEERDKRYSNCENK